MVNNASVLMHCLILHRTLRAAQYLNNCWAKVSAYSAKFPREVIECVSQTLCSR